MMESEGNGFDHRDRGTIGHSGLVIAGCRVRLVVGVRNTIELIVYTLAAVRCKPLGETS